jgi:hypothetical protein
MTSASMAGGAEAEEARDRRGELRAVAGAHLPTAERPGACGDGVPDPRRA